MIRCFKWFLNNVILSTPIVCIVLVIINIYIIHYSCTINSSTLDVGIIASVCCLTNSPSWPKFELRPSWNNIHDTFPPIGTAQDTTLYRASFSSDEVSDTVIAVLQTDVYVMLLSPTGKYREVFSWNVRGEKKGIFYCGVPWKSIVKLRTHAQTTRLFG